jgi:hypothetical protein
MVTLATQLGGAGKTLLADLDGSSRYDCDVRSQLLEVVRLYLRAGQ